MTPSPDPLFRNGLENYQKPAPASVWDRVEAGLDRKRRKGVWLKVAAGLCLLIATSFMFWPLNDPENAVAAASKDSAKISSNADTISSVVQEAAKSFLRESSVACTERSRSMSREVRAMENSQHSQVNSIVERSRNNHPDVITEGFPVVERSRNEPLKGSQQSAVGSKQSEVGSLQSSVGRFQSSVGSQQLAVGSQKSVNTLNDIQPITLIEPEEIVTTPTPVNSIEGSDNNVIVEQKGTSITYTAAQVNSKFIKKEKVLEATPAKKNTSGLQKVIDKALDLTNEGTVYGELREKKNEWLSFTMLSNKTEANK